MRYPLLLIITCMAFTSYAQHVGIGTLTPAFKLDVKDGSINTDSLYRINAFSVLSVKGNGNLFSGKSAGLNNTGYNNSFVGDSAGIANTSGYNNSFFGFNAGLNNISGFANSGFGAGTLNSNSTGFLNTAVGYQTLFSNTTGLANTAIGASTLALNGGGSYNTAIGQSSLSHAESGMNNTAVGANSMWYLTTGAGNTGLGYSALWKTTTGEQNTGVGIYALSENVTGSYNAGLGYNAEVAYDNLTNATAIGARSLVGSSNSIVLGSIAGLNGASTSARIGIGTPNPQTALDVVSASNNIARFTGPEGMYINLTENSDYRGYIGSYSGKAADVDFGTGAGNTGGDVHLTIQGIPKLTVQSGGNIDIAGEMNHSSTTGTANLLPVCYGAVSAAGVVTSGSGNFSVTTVSPGLYTISITGESFIFSGYTAIVTPIGITTPRMAGTSSGSGNLLVKIFDISGTATDTPFTFVVYQQ